MNSLRKAKRSACLQRPTDKPGVELKPSNDNNSLWLLESRLNPNAMFGTIRQ